MAMKDSMSREEMALRGERFLNQPETIHEDDLIEVDAGVLTTGIPSRMKVWRHVGWVHRMGMTKIKPGDLVDTDTPRIVRTHETDAQIQEKAKLMCKSMRKDAKSPSYAERYPATAAWYAQHRGTKAPLALEALGPLGDIAVKPLAKILAEQHEMIDNLAKLGCTVHNAQHDSITVEVPAEATEEVKRLLSLGPSGISAESTRKALELKLTGELAATADQVLRRTSIDNEVDCPPPRAVADITTAIGLDSYEPEVKTISKVVWSILQELKKAGALYDVSMGTDYERSVLNIRAEFGDSGHRLLAEALVAEKQKVEKLERNLESDRANRAECLADRNKAEHAAEDMRKIVKVLREEAEQTDVELADLRKRAEQLRHERNMAVNLHAKMSRALAKAQAENRALRAMDTKLNGPTVQIDEQWGEDV